MIMARIKICGVRDPMAAGVAAEAGADFIGIVFVPGSRRRLDGDVAGRIVSSLREKLGTQPKVVGLFADQPLREVQRLVGHCGLDMVQLCGSESIHYCGQVGVPVIKVLHVSDSRAGEDDVALLSEEMAALKERDHLATLDRKVEGLKGGTGQSFDWDIAKTLSTKGFPFLLAGGLTPETVGSVVRTVRPWGVDVSSGVETRGEKDLEKIRAFIQAVRAAEPSVKA